MRVPDYVAAITSPEQCHMAAAGQAGRLMHASFFTKNGSRILLLTYLMLDMAHRNWRCLSVLTYVHGQWAGDALGGAARC